MFSHTLICVVCCYIIIVTLYFLNLLYIVGLKAGGFHSHLEPSRKTSEVADNTNAVAFTLSKYVVFDINI